jgi:uncharacterized RDD family membrane protein YckC
VTRTPTGEAVETRQVRAATPQAIALAEPWRRLLAFVIDAAILALATGALWGRLLASFASRMSSGAYGRVLGHTVGPYLIVLVPTIVVAIAYYWLLTAYWGTTIGKRALGTWVVTADCGSRVSLRRSFARALVFVFGGEVIPLFFFADNLWPAPAGTARQGRWDTRGEDAARPGSGP